MTFFLGEHFETVYQYVARIGIAVMSPYVRVPRRDPRAMKSGTTIRREIKSVFEKLSLPAPSAGRGPFLMEGYYEYRQKLVRRVL